MLAGHQYVKPGMIIDFGVPETAVEGFYRTAVLCYAAKLCTYARDQYALVSAAQRMYATREMPPGRTEAEARANQLAFFASHRHVYEELAREYAPFFDNYKGSYQEALEHHADPHPKRALRIQAWAEIQAGHWDIENGTGLNTLLYKVKGFEYAKPGKKPRAIGDLGVVASLVGFRLLEMLKTAQAAVRFYYRGGVAIFVKGPRASFLHEAFDLLLNPEDVATFVYFSDDSCLAYRVEGRVHLFNLDIKSCDASHTNAVFDLLKLYCPPGRPRDDMTRVVAQCNSPFRLQCPEDPKRVVILQGTETNLFSGSVATTAANNGANQSIFMAIMERGYTGLIVDGEAIEIVQAAYDAGYVLSGCTPFFHPEGLQFLKHSPVLDSHGVYRPMLNVGTLLRSYGISHGDIPGRGSLETRAREFCQAIIRSSYPKASFDLLDILRDDSVVVRDSITQSVTIAHIREKVEVDDYPCFRASTSSICARYGITDDEWYELLFLSSQLRFGHIVNCTALAKILRMDYDADTSEDTDFSYVNAQYPTPGFTLA